ncbi:N-acetyltransferase [candidate division KSB1 bacterium]|nr:N-acetyltransferase [candidate division KSB1 bacterium]
MPDLEFETKLADGTNILVRKIQDSDKPCLMTEFDKLSPNSRHCRFLSSMNRLPDRYATYLTNIDHYNHVALCVSDISDSKNQGIGVARFIRLHDQPSTAEFAITVVDEYHGRGLGSLLMDILIQFALDNGIKHFEAYVLNSNDTMKHMLINRGATWCVETDATLHFRLSLQHENNNRNWVFRDAIQKLGCA